MKAFRSKHPTRTYTGTPKAKYSDYHNELREDFNHRCGYTDCSDKWWQDGFHIDHFAPKKPRIKDAAKKTKFALLEHEYSNLVYACPQINRAKKNDWPSDDPSITEKDGKGYIDPCNDFNLYFERTDTGGIVPKDNPSAIYMWNKLKLYLLRYELYWRMEQLAIKKERLSVLSRTVNLPAEIAPEVLSAMNDLEAEYNKYEKYLDINYREIIR